MRDTNSRRIKYIRVNLPNKIDYCFGTKFVFNCLDKFTTFVYYSYTTFINYH